jgi:hypothetical protein
MKLDIKTQEKKDYKPFWDDSCKVISSNLLSHTQISSASLESACSRKMVENSWFLTERKFHPNKNSQENYLKSYISSLV